MPAEDREYLGKALRYELVPPFFFHKAPRSQMPARTWKKISSFVAERADHRCEICGDKGREAHERYSILDDTLIIRRVMYVCRDCHMTLHPGFAQIMGRLGYSFARYARINNVSEAVAVEDVRAAFARWESMAFTRIRKLDWSLFVHPPYAEFFTNQKVLEKARMSEKKSAEGKTLTDFGVPLAYFPDRD